MKIKAFIFGIAVLALIGIIYLEKSSLPSIGIPLISTQTGQTSGKYPINIPLRDFTFNQLILDSGSNFKLVPKNLSSIKTENTIIHFWASWCSVCNSEWLDIINFAEHNPEITVLTISIDHDKGQFTDFITKLDKEHNISKNQNLLFALNENNISLELFNTESVPENYFVKLIDGKYVIVNKAIGKGSWK